MIKTVGDIRKAINGLPDEMKVHLYVYCEPRLDNEELLCGAINFVVDNYTLGKALDLKVRHFCPDAYENQKEEETND